VEAASVSALRKIRISGETHHDKDLRCNCTCEERRDRIADLAEAVTHVPAELKCIREGLQPRRLSNRNHPRLRVVVMDVAV
jgi:hypothetical protein